MGTTLTTALVLWPFVYIAHVGDTRCYLFEAGQLRCLTTDHNLAQKFVEASAQPVDPPERLKHVLWNALGGGTERAVPDVSKVEVGPDAVLLLCSDGLNKHVSDPTIASVLASNTPCAERAAKLVELANAGGGTDNITAIVAHVRES
jgi:protein phosphatase